MRQIDRRTDALPSLSLPDWALEIETPAFVFDLRVLHEAMRAFVRVREETGARILYALKPLVYPDALREMCGILDGFAASSLNEATIAREILGDGRGKLSITTPAYRPREMERIGALCDHVVLNSLGQWERFGPALRASGTDTGLRVNPGLSLVDDTRYDPCRPGSKLGVSLEAAVGAFASGALAGLAGLHLHTNAGGLDYSELERTVERVTAALDGPLRNAGLRWFNLGGGYLRPDDTGRAALYRTITWLHERYDLQVWLEPGAALVGEAGSLVSTVLDVFDSGGETVAVLDTSVNHAPEVFEYQYRPSALSDAPENPFPVTLAGATCLAGDLFGSYRFADPLRTGDRIIFPHMGAYTQPKAHWFNGVGLPSLYTIGNDGQARLRRRYTCDDYRRRLELDPPAEDPA